MRLTCIPGLLVPMGLIYGCSVASPANPPVEPTSLGDCLGRPVFTAVDMRRAVDCHPNDYKLWINTDTAVLFAFPWPTIDWAGPIFIDHIPSVSQAVVNIDGSLILEDYKSPEGRAAIEAVMNNPGLMSDILARALKIQKHELLGPLPPTLVPAP